MSIFAEVDYCYGIGPLALRIERIEWSTPTWYDGEEWYPVVGIEIDATGSQWGPRQVLVRARKLPPPPGSKPH